MKVVGLGAWCDYVTEDEYRERRAGAGPPSEDEEQVPAPGLAPVDEEEIEHFRRGASFDVHEFAVLANGCRLTLHSDRGFTVWAHTTGQSAPIDTWTQLTAESLEADVRTTVLPDDDDTEDDHPWEWLAGLLRAHGVEVSSEQFTTVPTRWSSAGDVAASAVVERTAGVRRIIRLGLGRPPTMLSRKPDRRSGRLRGLGPRSSVAGPDPPLDSVDGDVSAEGEDPLWSGVAEWHADADDCLRVVPRDDLDCDVALVGAVQRPFFR